MAWGQSSTVSASLPQKSFAYYDSASSTNVDTYAQSLLQEQAEAGAEPDTSLGPYITSILRETDPQTPVHLLPEYESLRELVQEHCFLDALQAGTIVQQIATAVRLNQVPTLTGESQPVVSPHAESTLIPGDLWDDSAQQVSHGGPPPHDNGTYPPQNLSEDVQLSNSTHIIDETYRMEQAFESSVDILLSMNPEISEEAARHALHMVHGDVNWGQYIVDAALTAPPVCRHLMKDACYRKDCQFSHDIDGHTCIFWMRGRCGKGASCRFRHGFDEKILEAALPVEESKTSEVTGVLNRDEDPPLSTSYPALSVSTSDPIWGHTSSASSFAQVASQGGPPESEFPSLTKKSSRDKIRRVDIPQDLWQAHESRDSSVFYISDPLERYHAVSATWRRNDVIDLHFQSLKTFGVVLEAVLPPKLQSNSGGVWIVTGTGHHVGSRTHQKGGGALESAVIEWLTTNGYRFARGRDKNGLGGALLVQG